MRTKQFSWLNIFIHVIFILFSAACIVPLIIVAAASLSTESGLVEHGYWFWPRGLSLKAYQYVFGNPIVVFRAYGVTLLTTAAGTLLGVSMMTLTAYTLSRPDFKYRGFIGFLVYFTLLFNGGIVATYIWVTRYLKMGNTLWALFLPTLVMPYLLFIMRRFVADIPMELVESAKIDGANEYTIFGRIVVPLSKPGIAAISLLLVLMYWNSFFPSLLYIDSEKLYTLQYLLYKLMANVEMLKNPALANQGIIIDVPTITLRMATCVVAVGPMVAIFPFFQKYFVKGLTAGAVKG